VIGVILDEASFNQQDLDLSRLLTLLPQWRRYASTSSEQLEQHLNGCTVAVANKIIFDRELISSLPQLSLILLTATGMNNVDLMACKENDITVLNVEDYCTASVSQHVFSLILYLTNQLNHYQQKEGKEAWSTSPSYSPLEFPIMELSGKKLGIVGYGALGKGVAQLAQAFGMTVLIANRVNSAPQTGRLPLNELLEQADVVSLHCPLVDETLHLISAPELALMKPTALLINTARGAIIDAEALAVALQTGVIAGAGIDVLDQEPPPLNHPLIARDIPNLIVTPHIAWASKEARQRVIDRVADNLQAWLN